MPSISVSGFLLNHDNLKDVETKHQAATCRVFAGRVTGIRLEQLTLNQRVQGSSPCAPTIKSST